MLPRHLPWIVTILELDRTFNEISHAAGIPPSTLSRCLKVLREHGAVKPRALTPEEEAGGGEGSYGQWKYALTSKGTKLLKKARVLVKATEDFEGTLTGK